MFYKFLGKKSASLLDKSVLASSVNIKLTHNEQLSKELHKPTIRNFEKKTVYSEFKDNIWDVDLGDMQIWRYANITKESSIYCVQLICLINMHGLLL